MAASNNSLRSYVDRILNVMAEQDALGDDKKEIYKEVAGSGLDRTVVSQIVGHLRKKAKKPGKFVEQSALFNLYLSEYEGVGTKNANAHAAREDQPEAGAPLLASGVESHVADAAAAVPADATVQPSSAGTEGDADRQPILPDLVPDAGNMVEASESTAAGKDRRDNSTEGSAAPQALDPEAATTPPAAYQPPVDTQPTNGLIDQPDNVSPISAGKRQWRHADPAHRDCLDPGQCGGLSNHGLCERCVRAAAGQERSA